MDISSDNPYAPPKADLTLEPLSWDDEWTEDELCICCLHPNFPDSLFCEDCGAPINPLAAILPWESTLARGFVYRRAVERPAHWWIVFGFFVMSFSDPTYLLAAVRSNYQYVRAPPFVFSEDDDVAERE